MRFDPDTPDGDRSAVVVVAFVSLERPAREAKNCGIAARPYTDGGALVTVRKGALKCATERGVMRAYWQSEVYAFRSTVRLKHAGIRWTCRPTTLDFPFRWQCRV